jgi:O-antigen/teichoic acid export membrane protein
MVGLILLPILSRVFAPSDYGIIDLMTVSYAFSLVALKLDVHSGLQRFYFRYEVEQRRTAVTSCVVFLALVTSIAALVLALFSATLSSLFSGDPEKVRTAAILLAACLPIEATWESLVLLLRLNRKATIFSLANIARVIVTPLTTYLFVVQMRSGVSGIFAAKLLSLSTISATLFWIQRSEFAPHADFRAFMRITRFSLPGHPGLLIREAMNLLPRYLLAYFAPLSAVGLFGIAFRISNIMRLVVGAFNRAWNPFAYSNEGAADERRIYEIVFKSFFGGMLIIATGLSLFARELLVLLTPAEYLSAYLLVPGIVGYLAAEGLTLIFSTALYTRNEVRWISYLNLTRLAVFLVAGTVLIPRYHAAGLVVSLNLAALSYLFLFGWITRRSFEFSIPIAKMLLLVAVAAALVVSGNSLAVGFVLALAAKAAALIVMAILVVLLLLTPGERKRLQSLSRTGFGSRT